MSKGSNRRPLRVSPEEFRRNWDRVFGPRPDPEVLRKSMEDFKAGRYRSAAEIRNELRQKMREKSR